MLLEGYANFVSTDICHFCWNLLVYWSCTLFVVDFNENYEKNKKNVSFPSNPSWGSTIEKLKYSKFVFSEQ